MSFLKDLGKFVGEVAGDVVGGTVTFAGEVTGSDFLQEVGEGVRKAGYVTGELAGNAASGIWDIGAGIVTQDGKQFEEGFYQVGSAVGSTVIAIGTTVGHVAENGMNVIEGVITENDELMSQGAKNLAKVAAIGILAVGVVDVIDGVDGIDAETLAESEDITSENENVHHVDPHWVEGYDRADGTHVEGYFRDGDGDTSVNSGDGWIQHNPD